MKKIQNARRYEFARCERPGGGKREAHGSGAAPNSLFTRIPCTLIKHHAILVLISVNFTTQHASQTQI